MVRRGALRGAGVTVLITLTMLDGTKLYTSKGRMAERGVWVDGDGVGDWDFYPFGALLKVSKRHVEETLAEAVKPRWFPPVPVVTDGAP
jgi:hypothetical protein